MRIAIFLAATAFALLGISSAHAYTGNATLLGTGACPITKTNVPVTFGVVPPSYLIPGAVAFAPTTYELAISTSLVVPGLPAGAPAGTPVPANVWVLLEGSGTIVVTSPIVPATGNFVLPTGGSWTGTITPDKFPSASNPLYYKFNLTLTATGPDPTTVCTITITNGFVAAGPFN
jgi:hypothetical protein